MTTETIDIRIREDGSRVVKRNLDDIAGSADHAANSMDFLKRALGLVVGALAIDKIREYADAWSSATGLIQVATKSTEEAATVQDKLFAAAQRTRTSFTDFTELYARAARSGKELGASQQEVIEFTEGVGKALVIQHTSATQASGALLQLGQLLGTGKVKAQEFNSVNEQLAVVLQTVANHTKGADGSIAKLRQQMLDGKLTSRGFFDAFRAGSKDLQSDFDKASATIGQGLTVIRNAVTKYVGELDHAIGGSNAFKKAAESIAANMPLIASGLVAVGAAALVAFSLTNISAFTGAVIRLFAIINTNPFVALATALVAAFVYFRLVGDELDAGIDKVTSYNDVFRAFGEVAKEGTSDIAKAIGDEFAKLTDTTFPDFFATTHKGFAGMLQIVARVFDSLGAAVYSIIFIVRNVVTGIPDLFKAGFQKAANHVIDAIENMANFVIGGLNKIREVLGADPIDPLKFVRLDADPAAWATYGKGIMNGIDQGIEAQGGALEQALEGVFTRAQKISADRIAALPKAPNADLGKHPPPTPPIVDAHELQKAKNELRGLLNTIDPAAGALLNMAHAQEIVNNAVKAGIIDQLYATTIMGEVKAHYEDVLNPLGEFHRGLALEEKALSGNITQLESYSTALQFQEDQRKKNNFVSDATVAKMTEELEAHKKLQRVVAGETAALNETVNARRAFGENLTSISKLLADSNAGFTKTDAAQVLVKSYGDLLQGTELWVQGTIASYTGMYAQIKQLRDKNLIDDKTAAQLTVQTGVQVRQKLQEAALAAAQIRLQLGTGDWADVQLAALGRLAQGFTTFEAGASAAMGEFFTSFTQGFADSVGKAVVESKNLGDALRSVAQQAVEQLISALVRLGVQWLAQQAIELTATETKVAAKVTGESAVAAATAAASAAQATAAVAAIGAVATASTLAAGVVGVAWATPAALVSLASFGQNAVPATAGILETTAIAQALALSGLGFMEGGYTGNAAANEVAGVVHGQEYVVNADGTRRNRAVLEAMNNGATFMTQSAKGGGSSTNGATRVFVQNNGTPQTYQADRMDQHTIRLIAEDVVQRRAPQVIARDLNNPNSSTSKSMRNNTLTPRRRVGR